MTNFDHAHTQTLGEIRRALADLKTCTHPDFALIKRLEGLTVHFASITVQRACVRIIDHLVAIADRELDAERSTKRSGPPNG